MMPDATDEDEWLLELARQVVAGAPVDWAVVESNTPHEAARALIRDLRMVAQIADVHTNPPLAVDSLASVSSSALGVALAPLEKPEVPDTWGPLRLLEKVGEGSFGEVYRAWDTRLDREVALKLLYRRESAHSRRASTVIDEGRLLARVRHPNVVTVHGAERVAGRVGLWMEFVRGRTLEQVLREAGPFSAEEATLVGLDLCRAVAAVHRAGLLHRDIKAQNVMREDDGRVVLMDFGTGLDREEAVDETRSELAGTPLYLAPEIFQGEPPTVRSDLYSLGVVLYHLVTRGYPVFGRTVREVREKHERGERALLRDARPDLPDRFVQAVERALAPVPEARYENAAALEEALAASTEIVRDEQPAEPSTSSDAALNASRAVATPDLPSVARLAGRPLALSLAGVLAVLLLIAFSFNLGGWRQRLAGGQSFRSGAGAPPAPSGFPSTLVTRQLNAKWDEIDISSGAPSADGRFFTGRDLRADNLMILDLASGTTRRVTIEGGASKCNPEDTRPSPDGQQIAYVCGNEGNYDDLWVGPIDRGTHRLVYRDRDVAHIMLGNWSEDGQRVALLVTRKDRTTHNLAVVSVVDGRISVLKSWTGYPPQRIDLSADGRFVVYDLLVDDESGNHDIFLRAVDADVEFPLVDHQASDLYPTWTRDSQNVLFVSTRAGMAGLWRIPLRDGAPIGAPEVIHKNVGRMYPLGVTARDALYYLLQTGLVNVYVAPLDLASGIVGTPIPATEKFFGSNISPDWSFDGRWLTFVSERGPAQSGPGWRLLVLQDSLGRETRELTPKLNFFIRPRWAPDGRSIVVLGTDLQGRWGAHRIDAQTGQVIGQLVAGTTPCCDWLPSSDTVVFVRSGALLALDLTTGITREAYSPGPGSRVSTFAVSGEGRRLALGLYRSNNKTTSLVVASPDGKQTTELMNVKSPESLSVEGWTGEEILFLKRTSQDPPSGQERRELWVVSTAGGEPRNLGLSMEGLREVRVHPDGRRIAFTSGWPRSDLFVMEKFLPEAR